MVNLECKISDLQTVCKLIAQEGKNFFGKEFPAVTDMLINAYTDGHLEVSAIDNVKSLVVKLRYAISVKEAGQVPIGDILAFAKFLERFDSNDTVTLSTTDNKIIIERSLPKKTARIPKASVEAIMSKDTHMLDKVVHKPNGFYTVGNLNYNLKAIIDASKIQAVIDDGSVVKQRIYPWLINDGKLSVSIGSEEYGEFSTEVPLESLESDPESPGTQTTKTAFASGIDNVFGNLSGKVSIFFTDNKETFPIIITQNTEVYSFFAILAPHAGT